MAWWRHQMETFSALLAQFVGNSPVTGEFPSQRPVTRSFGVSFETPGIWDPIALIMTSLYFFRLDVIRFMTHSKISTPHERKTHTAYISSGPERTGNKSNTQKQITKRDKYNNNNVFESVFRLQKDYLALDRQFLFLTLYVLNFSEGT